ncbi:hypothetical protein [Urechidicola croceus]|uniref:Insecticidal crystal toxin domain-containing protein n=1 Tax=Urechidicola croceus TaxID=1850246 RepID=A0A1D8P5D8_9FLAO|nr:hypothetical protein [Urechidicola croceus]AOW19788.1 hypothetical protein LPB138_03405 [Urechidicola croceus]
MEITKTLLTKTCHFIIQTTFGNDLVAQESGSGTSGHLLRYPPPNGVPNQYYKFLIYHDPDKDRKFRMVVVGWPEFQVQLESDRARIVKFADSDYQRFIFKIAPPPTIETDKNKQWYYLQGIGVNLNFDFATHRYVFPSINSKDEAKLKLVPIDVVEPDTSKLQAPISLLNSEIKPPAHYINTEGDEWGNKVISKEAIPASLIKDEDYRTKSDQIKISPYYYLKREKFWSSKRLPIITLSKQNKTEVSEEYTSSFTSTDYQSVEKVIGHTFNASIEVYGKKTTEVGVQDSGLSASQKNEVGGSLKLAYQFQDQTTTLNQKTQSKEENIKKTLKKTYRQLDSNEGDIRLRHWVPVDRYTLTNSRGKIIGQWEHTDPNQITHQEVNR